MLIRGQRSARPAPILESPCLCGGRTRNCIIEIQGVAVSEKLNGDASNVACVIDTGMFAPFEFHPQLDEHFRNAAANVVKVMSVLS